MSEEELADKLTAALQTIREVCTEYCITAELRIGPLDGKMYSINFTDVDKEGMN